MSSRNVASSWPDFGCICLSAGSLLLPRSPAQVARADLRTCTHTRQFELLHSAYTTSIYQKQIALSPKEKKNKRRVQKCGLLLGHRHRHRHRSSSTRNHPIVPKKKERKNHPIFYCQKTRSHPTGGRPHLTCVPLPQAATLLLKSEQAPHATSSTIPTPKAISSLISLQFPTSW
ncbi:hypothetical protein C2845_PM16G24990 [Panicum miliaceum]|uniref:Uncharacterized protein n=1 Tax=Panicum miliaceum TaxID=4540 RepID=A0A3L6PZE4_PANMI|nr:hypothetical protein C2845_PM16G24990 [Panicum miliaceum]